jgi:hypothetical protein
MPVNASGCAGDAGVALPVLSGEETEDADPLDGALDECTGPGGAAVGAGTNEIGTFACLPPASPKASTHVTPAVI